MWFIIAPVPVGGCSWWIWNRAKENVSALSMLRRSCQCERAVEPNKGSRPLITRWHDPRQWKNQRAAKLGKKGAARLFPIKSFVNSTLFLSVPIHSFSITVVVWGVFVFSQRLESFGCRRCCLNSVWTVAKTNPPRCRLAVWTRFAFSHVCVGELILVHLQ